MVSVTTSPAPLLESYLELTGSGRFSADAQQRKAVEALDQLWRLLQTGNAGTNSFGSLLHRLTGRYKKQIPGIYLWGDVGRGKTWLMDLFYESLPVERKRRIHFHRFMQRVHEELKAMPRVQDPLPRIAKKWSEGIRLLCLDEFFVSDIADAMLLSGLLEALFEHGVTLVTTSNSPPDELYKEGLQRGKFLPAIALLKQNCEVIQVAGQTDYRLRILEKSNTYRFPLDEDSEAELEASYEQIACGSDLNPELKVNARTITARRRSDGVAWFEFITLCDGPRGSADYIELARAFNTILISGVTVMTEADSDIARRFVTMIDEFYDRNVKVLITAEAGFDALYTGQRLAFEFQRTTSRLTEMQTHDYLARPHLA
jgi:cell division protein ZapE